MMQEIWRGIRVRSRAENSSPVGGFAKNVSKVESS